MSSPTSAYSMDIESAALPVAQPKPQSRRTTYIISAIVAILVIVAVIATAVTLHNSSSSSSSAQPATRTLGRTVNVPSWELDTGRKSAIHRLAADPLVASRADPNDAHDFLWSFPPRNQQWLDAELEAVSNPSSPRYTQYPTFDELMAQVGPSADEKAAVVAWLQANGVSADVISDRGNILHVASTVGQVESLFQTTMHYYKHRTTGQNGTVSAGDVTVPANLSVNAIHSVYGYPNQLAHIGTHLATATPRVKQAVESHDMQPMAAHSFHTMETNKKCSGSFSYTILVGPQFLATAYNYPVRNTSTTATNTSACVTAFGGQAFLQSDLTHQQTNIGFSQSFAHPTVFNPSGNSANLAEYGAGDEADLDIQALYQVSPTSNNSFYSSSAGGQNSLLQTLSAIAALPAKQRPQVVSISYGFGVSDYQYYYSTDGPNTETTLQHLATLGVTVIASSGDDGANGGYNRQCSTNPNSLGDGTVTPFTTTTFLPTYPASSTYVLAVGETDFLASATSSNAAFGAFSTSPSYPPECDNCPTDESYGFLCQSTNLGEEVVSSGNKNAITGQTSGGGFSTVFVVPSWQSNQTAAYLNSKCASSPGCTLPPAGYYYSNARGYPDVVAFGGEFGITYNGEETVVGGTSVAAPIWAGIMARLNEGYLARKGTTLGMVAPLFYQMAAAQPNTFHDITTGENTCPQGNSTCATYIQTGQGSTSCAGWRGAVGWDPVTGLGSPNVGNIISYLSTH